MRTLVRLLFSAVILIFSPVIIVGMVFLVWRND